MEIQWGKNPEYTFYVYFQPRFLALPLQIGWFFYNDAINNKNYSVSLHFLCFGIKFEIWKWTRKPNKLTQETLEKSERGEDLHECDSIDDLIKELNNEN